MKSCLPKRLDKHLQNLEAAEEDGDALAGDPFGPMMKGGFSPRALQLLPVTERAVHS
jgi:hypothetical protein